MAIRFVNPNSTAGGDGTTNAITGANRAYVSLNAWESARQNPALTEIEECICETNGNADTTAVVIDGWGTSATNYIYIHTSVGHRHAGVFDASKYRLAVSPSFDSVLRSLEEFLRIEGLQIKQTSTAVEAEACLRFAGLTAGGDIRVTECLLYGNDSGGSTDRRGVGISCYAACTYTIRNCIIYDCNSRGISGNMGFSGTRILNIDNCTIANCTTYGIMQEDGGTVTVRNTYCNGGTDAYNGTMTRTTCAHSSATVFAGSTASIAHSNANFVNVTAGSENYHLAGGSALIGAGTDLSGTFTTDIDGETRSAPWDIGADEVVSVAAVSMPSNNSRLYSMLLAG